MSRYLAVAAVRALVGGVLVAAAALLVGVTSASAAPVAKAVSAPVDGARTLRLPLTASHVALHWRGPSSARVSFALSRDGRRFGPMRRVRLDEVGEQHPGRETWGAVTPARGVVAVRVRSSARLSRLTVLGLRDRSRRRPVAAASSHLSQPAVVTRAGWGADESLRLRADGSEIWPPAFHPTQKLIVHHTAGRNDDPDPAATLRSIYYYHAVTQGWGDIGYNFLIDESGRVYEGRYARTYAPGESPTGEDLTGSGVTAAHASGYNSGTVGVALLGTLTNRDATPAARDALERLLAWKAERSGIDPQGASLYTNPVNGTQRTFANIAGHRDLNATECPGDVFHATPADLRSRVAALVADGGPQPDTTAPSAPQALVALGQSRAVALDWADNAEADLAGYRVYRRGPDGTWPTTPLATVSSSAYRDSGLKSRKTYAYRVTAFDAAGNQSAPSSSASATTGR